MSVPLTEITGIEYDVKRELFLGKDVLLYLLRFTGDDEYALNKVVNAGWLPERKTAADGAIYTEVKICDMAGDLAAAVDGDEETGRTTDFAIGTEIYKVEPEFTKRPLMEPKIWVLRGYATGKVYDTTP